MTARWSPYVDKYVRDLSGRYVYVRIFSYYGNHEHQSRAQARDTIPFNHEPVDDGVINPASATATAAHQYCLFNPH
jgi:hypothetical protein